MLVCVGSAHIDILAKQNGISGADQKGDVVISIGGTAYNVACNLRKHGAQVALVTVLKKSVFGHVIIQKLSEYGIITDWVREDPNAKESIFISVSNSDELICAVNSIAIENYHITQLPEATAYFVDLNNGDSTIKSVLAKGAPTYLNLVSEDKATKLISLYPLNNYKNIKTISGNANEYIRLLNESGFTCMEELSISFPHIEFIYTMGKEGLKLFKGGRTVCSKPGQKVETDKYIQGAGDALLSGYMFAREIKEASIEESIDFSITHSVLPKLLTYGANLMENNFVEYIDDIMYIDQLTKLYNRRFCERRKSQFDNNYSVIAVDIDKFKSINDTYGHDAGDEVLKQVATLLRQKVRKSDFVIRWGGEEFIILYHGDINKAIKTAERIREAIQHTPIVYKDFVLNITASFGVSEVSKNASIDEAVTDADKLLYKAKKNGRNRVEYFH